MTWPEDVQRVEASTVDTALRAARTPTPPGLLTEVLHASFRWVRLNNALRVTLDDIQKARQEWRALLGKHTAKRAEWEAHGRVKALERRAVRISVILETIEERTERKVVAHV